MNQMERKRARERGHWRMTSNKRTFHGLLFLFCSYSERLHIIKLSWLSLSEFNNKYHEDGLFSRFSFSYVRCFSSLSSSSIKILIQIKNKQLKFFSKPNGSRKRLETAAKYDSAYYEVLELGIKIKEKEFFFSDRDPFHCFSRQTKKFHSHYIFIITMCI